jgi:saccharopine dehydrogenase-like NADP-dependent oxidoreductase
VGHVIVQDLLDEKAFRVLAVDRSPEALERLVRREDDDAGSRLETRAADLSRPDEIMAIAREADLVVGAVPGSLGATILDGVLEAGVPLVDISFSPEDPTLVHQRAVVRGVPVVVDCGLAPGLSNLLVGREVAAMDKVQDVLILVGGLPEERRWPFEYRFVFSPADVIEEYTRPCRCRVDGVERTLPALSELEPVDFPGVGTLEAFNTDGLRTLLATIPARTMREKTLRYPGHAEKMLILRETGFFRTDPIDVGGHEVTPRALTEKLLLEALRLRRGERDLTLMRIVVDGSRQGVTWRVTWNLVDRPDADGRSSMARTTGFPCALMARLVLAGAWTRPGVVAPEAVGRETAVADALLEGLAARDIRLERTETRRD